MEREVLFLCGSYGGVHAEEFLVCAAAFSEALLCRREYGYFFDEVVEAALEEERVYLVRDLRECDWSVFVNLVG